MKIVMYGIPNCETVKKARLWLDAQNIPYQFHDFKKAGIDQTLLRDWLQDISLDVLLNRRGATWRALPDEVKAAATDEARILELIVSRPSLIKRPVLTRDGRVQAVGFSAEAYNAFLARS